MPEKLRLSVRVLPWDIKSLEFELNEHYQQDFPPFLHPCSPNATIGDLCYQLEARFQSLFPCAGNLRIKCLETEDRDILDSDLLLGDCFDHRSVAGKGQWTVCVRREPPTAEQLRLLGNIRFSSILATSGARPPKRPYGEIYGRFNSPSRDYGSAEQYGTSKRQRSERETVARALQENQPVASVEKDTGKAEARPPSADRHASPVIVEDSQRPQRQVSYITPRSIPTNFPPTGVDQPLGLLTGNGLLGVKNVSITEPPPQKTTEEAALILKDESPNLERMIPDEQHSRHFSLASPSEVQINDQPMEFLKPLIPEPRVIVPNVRSLSREAPREVAEQSPKKTTPKRVNATTLTGRLTRPSANSIKTSKENPNKSPKKKRNRDVFEFDTDIESSQELPAFEAGPSWRSKFSLRKTPVPRKFILPDTKTSSKPSPDAQAVRAISKGYSPSTNNSRSEENPAVKDGHTQHQENSHFESNADPMEVHEPHDSAPEEAKPKRYSTRLQAKSSAENTAVEAQAALAKGTKRGTVSRKSHINHQGSTNGALENLQATSAKKKRGRPKKAEQAPRNELLASPRGYQNYKTALGSGTGASVNATAREDTDMAARDEGMVDVTSRARPANNLLNEKSPHSTAQNRLETPQFNLPGAEDVDSTKSAMKGQKLAEAISSEQDTIQRLSNGLTTTPHRNMSITPYIPGRASSQTRGGSKLASSASVGNQSRITAAAHTPSRTTTDSVQAPKPSAKPSRPRAAQKRSIETPSTSAQGPEPSAKPSESKAVQEGSTKTSTTSVEPKENERATSRSRSVAPKSVKSSARGSFYAQLFAIARSRDSESRSSSPTSNTMKLNAKGKLRKAKSASRTASNAVNKSPFPRITEQARESSEKPETDPEEEPETTSLEPSKQTSKGRAPQSSKVIDAKKRSPSVSKSLDFSTIGLEEVVPIEESLEKSMSPQPPTIKQRKETSKSFSRSPARVVPKTSESVSESASDPEDTAEDSSETKSTYGSDSSSGASEVDSTVGQNKNLSEDESNSSSESEGSNDKEDMNRILKTTKADMARIESPTFNACAPSLKISSALLGAHHTILENESEESVEQDDNLFEEKSENPSDSKGSEEEDEANPTVEATKVDSFQEKSPASNASTPSLDSNSALHRTDPVTTRSEIKEPRLAPETPIESVLLSQRESQSSSLDAKKAANQLQLESSVSLTQSTQTPAVTKNVNPQSSQNTSFKSSSSRPSYLSSGKYPSLSEMKNTPLHTDAIKYPSLPPHKTPLSKPSHLLFSAALESSTDSSSSSEDDEADAPNAPAKVGNSQGGSTNRNAKGFLGLLTSSQRNRA